MNFKNDSAILFHRLANKPLPLFFLILSMTLTVFAQTQTRVPPTVAEQSEDYTWWYVTLFVLALALTGAVVWMLKTRKAEKEAVAEISRKEKLMSQNNAWETNSLDLDKEMEWYRRHKKSVQKSSKGQQRQKGKILENKLPKTGKIFNRKDEFELDAAEFSGNELQAELQNSQTSEPPIFRFQKLELARAFSPLSLSNDEDLMSAIEQTHDEYEEDEEVRELAVRILARFKTRNSIEALSQVALYDLSSNLRSKAVSILADFDHESVFETILLACADPTREVRAAAARGLFRLNFDRSDAWTRIAETGDEFRMRQAALAAKEADLVKRSFDRLIHPDQKVAYEAATLIALMIRAGETEEIFQAVEAHNDSTVKLAVLHVIGLVKEEETLAYLYEILEKTTISKEFRAKVDEVIQMFEMIPA